jgi:hypothetical protein
VDDFARQLLITRSAKHGVGCRIQFRSSLFPRPIGTPRIASSACLHAFKQCQLLLNDCQLTFGRFSTSSIGDIGHVEELDHLHALCLLSRRATNDCYTPQLSFRATGLLGLRAAAPNQATQEALSLRGGHGEQA